MILTKVSMHQSLTWYIMWGIAPSCMKTVVCKHCHSCKAKMICCPSNSLYCAFVTSTFYDLEEWDFQKDMVIEASILTKYWQTNSEPVWWSWSICTMWNFYCESINLEINSVFFILSVTKSSTHIMLIDLAFVEERLELEGSFNQSNANFIDSFIHN